MATPQPLKPIGFYLKSLDAAINEDFARTLSDQGLTRRDWQVLHNLALRGPLAEAELGELLRPFWEPGARTLDEVAGALAARGWLTVGGDGLAITPAGRQAHTEVAALIEGLRARLMRGLTDDEYLRTVTVLERMTANMTVGVTTNMTPEA